jgi:hypothetical protein
VKSRGNKSIDIALGEIVPEAGFRLECTLNALVEAFNEIAVTKHCIFDLMSRYNEHFCNQLEKFSVLAYDYLERIDNINKREI